MKQKNNKKLASTKKSFTRKQQILFSLILIAIPFIILVIIENSLVVSNYGHDLQLFQKSQLYPDYYEINPDVNLRYFSKVQKTSPSNDIFLIEKPDSCYRIFVFGGSTTIGFPFQESMSFPRILYYRLQDAFPSKRIEVVNLSAAALSSYCYNDILDEVIDMAPDAILIYGGHNEYYGALGVASVENIGNVRWIKKLRLKFIRFRTFQLLQNTFNKITSAFSPNYTSQPGTLMERIVKDKYIPQNSSLFKKGIDQFEDNITELVQKASQNNIPVVLSELVSNLSDQPPFKSDTINAAIDYYNKAQEKEQEEKTEEAKELYIKAKDLDLVRFRAPEIYNDFLNRIATKNKLAIVPMRSYFENNSPNNIVGHELMIDHLHPNVDGYFLMADAFFNTMKANGFIETYWDDNNIKPNVYYRNNWGYTELDSMIVDIRIQTLKAGWPFNLNQHSKRIPKEYLAKGVVGKMAADYYNDKANRAYEEGHLELATHYAQKEQYKKAYKEYLSLIKLHPYLTELYYDAAKLLLADQEYTKALELISSAPLLVKNFDYYFTTGYIQLELKEYGQAINALEKAYKMNMMNVESTEILFPLYNAYMSIDDESNSNRILKLIQDDMPRFDEGSIEEKTTQITYAEIYEQAKQYIINEEYEQAEELLNESNRLKELAPSYKLLAMSYIKQKKYATAFGYCVKSYELDATDTENLINYFNLCLMKHDFDTASRLLNELILQHVDEAKLKQLQDLFSRKQKAYTQ